MKISEIKSRLWETFLSGPEGIIQAYELAESAKDVFQLEEEALLMAPFAAGPLFFHNNCGRVESSLPTVCIQARVSSKRLYQSLRKIRSLAPVFTVHIDGPKELFNFPQVCGGLKVATSIKTYKQAMKIAHKTLHLERKRRARSSGRKDTYDRVVITHHDSKTFNFVWKKELKIR